MKKAIAIVFVMILVLNLVLFIKGMMSVWQFWSVIILAAAVAYLILPKIR